MLSSHSTFLRRARCVCVCAYAFVWVCVCVCLGVLMLEDHLVQAQLIASAWPASFVCALSRSHTHTQSSITAQGHVEKLSKNSPNNKWQTQQKKRVQNLHYVIVIDTLLAGFGFVALSILHKGEWKRERERERGGKTRRRQWACSICKRKHRSRAWERHYRYRP